MATWLLRRILRLPFLSSSQNAPILLRIGHFVIFPTIDTDAERFHHEGVNVSAAPVR